MATNLEIYDSRTGVLIARVEVMRDRTPQDFVSAMMNNQALIKTALSYKKAAAIVEGQKKDEADLKEPEEALARKQAESDALAAKLPDGDFELSDLKPKQLKGLCREKGLKDYGTGATMIKRLEEHEQKLQSEKLATAEAAAKESKEEAEEAKEALATATDVPPGDVDVDNATIEQLRELAAGYGVDTDGDREALIARILVAASTDEDIEALDSPPIDAGHE